MMPTVITPERTETIRRPRRALSAAEARRRSLIREGRREAAAGEEAENLRRLRDLACAVKCAIDILPPENELTAYAATCHRLNPENGWLRKLAKALHDTAAARDLLRHMLAEEADGAGRETGAPREVAS